MNQLIMRIRDTESDVEVLSYNDVEKKECFSTITVNDLLNNLNKFVTNRAAATVKKNIVLMDDETIGIGEHHIVIKQQQHKRIITFDGKAYYVSFPNSIYIINHSNNKIHQIHAYCYKKFDGSNTKLFKYAMPNMLTENRICMGNAPKDIEDGDYKKALEKIIFTQYSHDFTSNIKSFKNTIDYFDYLCNHEFPYDLLIDANQSLLQAIK